MPRNILVTDAGEEGENVMVFTNLDAPILAAALTARQFPFSDCHEVPDEDVQFHVFDPLWLSPATEHRCRLNVQAPPPTTSLR